MADMETLNVNSKENCNTNCHAHLTAPASRSPRQEAGEKAATVEELGTQKKKIFLMLELNFLGCSPNVGTGIQTDVQGQLRQVNGAVCSHATRTPFRICASSSRARQSY